MFIAAGALLWMLLKSRNMHIWIIAYIIDKLSPSRAKPGKKHIYFCVADHYEPYFRKADQATARKLVDDWAEKYKQVANKHHDSSGRPPQHSYFYPVEEYDEYVLDKLKVLCSEGYGDVDIHLHHDNDTADNLRQTLNDFKQLLHSKHGLMRKNERGEIVYGFIHGNWALDNSRPDGRWCGVDNELDILIETGCVYDMTMPSAPSDTQTSIINRIYFAKEDGKAKSHNHGTVATVGNWLSDQLLMIQGPLGLNWTSRKLGIMPKIDAGELSCDAPPAADRLAIWENAGVSVSGAENHIFIRLYTHGLQAKNMTMFYEQGGFDKLWTLLEQRYCDSADYSLHYVTAWEMYGLARSLITGKQT
ncbi:MAG: hypothetical protein QG652_1568 [Pseudomonadota bacterium]|nr:hypothetical protein [Pseudomonadota bacterium]